MTNVLHWEYFWILIFFLVSGIFLEWKYRIHLYESRKERVMLTLIFFFSGVAWDTIAVWRHHWSFLGPGLSGIKVGLLPVEEYLFMFVIPFFLLVIYKFWTKIIK